ncbi:enoyl-CoA hydratase/isomerase family protein [Streptomyces sp. NPDC005708]|uniref:enoyl-CoA hydratase/isomerase family protein n=1 Tax=Streptomyces sp. NPDC005708 TaxID=3154564 RepID=UPI0033D1069F
MLVERSEPRPGVRQLTLNRPDQLNALNRDMVAKLHAALTEIRADAACRVLILAGAGRAFCAGLDLNGYGDEQDDGYEPSSIHYFARQRQIADLSVQIHELGIPVIAAVNGAAAGGGLALACASDIRIASDTALFAVSFIRAGYSACDIGVSWLLPRIVGAGRAHELMLTGRRCPAAEAAAIGLVTDVVPAHALLARAYAEAEEIMLNPPFSVELTKAGMWHALESPSLRSTVDFENRQQILTALTEDCAEARAAFLDKRAPHYQYR